MRWENTVTIEAPVDVVWDLTIDVTRWPDMTPTMSRVERLDAGPLRVGSRARIKQPRQTEAVWTVTRLEPERVFAWQTKRMGLTMTGSHLLRPVGERCENTLTLDIEGRGAGLFGRLFRRVLADSIATENAGFRTTAQSAG